MSDFSPRLFLKTNMALALICMLASSRVVSLIALGGLYNYVALNSVDVNCFYRFKACGSIVP